MASWRRTLASQPVSHAPSETASFAWKRSGARLVLSRTTMATLTLLADGKANKEIANALEISERTVKSHLAHLFEKLGATSHTEAVKVATRRGLVRLD
jgi:DNA-binding NarL/FixJ family response regulator